jgi:hypothetical protein
MIKETQLNSVVSQMVGATLPPPLEPSCIDFEANRRVVNTKSPVGPQNLGLADKPEYAPLNGQDVK